MWSSGLEGGEKEGGFFRTRFPSFCEGEKEGRKEGRRRYHKSPMFGGDKKAAARRGEPSQGIIRNAEWGGRGGRERERERERRK